MVNVAVDLNKAWAYSLILLLNFGKYIRNTSVIAYFSRLYYINNAARWMNISNRRNKYSPFRLDWK